MDSNNSVSPQWEDEQARRIRFILGLARGPVPSVGKDWLLRYYDYLTARLQVPFGACHAVGLLSLRESVAPVTVLALVNPREHPVDEYAGLICRVRKGDTELDVPLVDLEVEPGHANYALLEDYWYWVWNWRFDPPI
jgi:hypothetical protein